MTMFRAATRVAVLPILMLALAGTQLSAAENPAAAAEVMAMARTQWAAEIAGKPVAEQIASTADDYTEFNPDYPALFVGKPTNMRFYEALTPQGRTTAAEMLNPHVQVYGDTAILSYNYVGVVKTSEGKTISAAGNSTRVYVRQGGKWMLVHGHFGPVGAPAK